MTQEEEETLDGLHGEIEGCVSYLHHLLQTHGDHPYFLVRLALSLMTLAPGMAMSTFLKVVLYGGGVGIY